MFRINKLHNIRKQIQPSFSYNLIFAIDDSNAIGYLNRLPWAPIKTDFLFFKHMTSSYGQNAVIMGSNTWRSLKQPLKNRYNIVISRENTYNNAYTFPTFEKYKNSHIKPNMNWVIGGKKIYDYIFSSEYSNIECIMMTRIHSIYPADTYLSLSQIHKNFELIHTHSVFDTVPITFYYYYNIEYYYLPNNKTILDLKWDDFINRNMGYR
jgi:dihydrofolate reductase